MLYPEFILRLWWLMLFGVDTRPAEESPAE